MPPNDSDLKPKVRSLGQAPKPPTPHLSLKDQKDKIEGLGKYFLTEKSTQLSSKTGEQDLLKKEDLINNWHKQAIHENVKGSIRDSLEDANNLMGAVVDRIRKKPDGVRNENHFSKLRKVGKKLITTRDLLDEEDNEK